MGVKFKIRNKEISLESGFTLVELIVVVMIIGILSSIAIPSFINAGHKAKQKEASILLSSYLKAAQAYYIETGSIPKYSEHLADYVNVTLSHFSSAPYRKSPYNTMLDRSRSRSRY